MAAPISAGGVYGDLPYKVADINLADFGRKEYDIAAFEMPGLANTQRVRPVPALQRCVAEKQQRLLLLTPSNYF